MSTGGRAPSCTCGSAYLRVIGTSDGGARRHSHDSDDYPTNLLGHWVREEQVVSLKEAVYRLTGKTALQHDLADRGFVAPGKVADITIFDPDTIASKPRCMTFRMAVRASTRVPSGSIMSSSMAWS
jgi:N-acyl-D-aspartate/D-glutamate deacylase